MSVSYNDLARHTIFVKTWSQPSYTPHLWREGCNSFDIDCVSVCLSVSLSKPNGKTYRLEFWQGGQVEGYQGQGQRSKVNVTRSENVHWDIPLTSESLAKEKFRKTTGRNTTWGVFKACAFFLNLNNSALTQVFPRVLVLFSWPQGAPRTSWQSTAELMKLPLLFYHRRLYPNWSLQHQL